MSSAQPNVVLPFWHAEVSIPNFQVPKGRCCLVDSELGTGWKATITAQPVKHCLYTFSLKPYTLVVPESLQFAIVVAWRSISRYRSQLGRVTLVVQTWKKEQDKNVANEVLREAWYTTHYASIDNDCLLQFELSSSIALSSAYDDLHERTVSFIFDAFPIIHGAGSKVVPPPDSVLFDFAKRSLDGVDFSNVRLDAFSRRIVTERGIGASHPRSVYANAKLLIDQCEYFADSE